MALPWLQIVQLVPSIVDVSRELLRKNKRPELDPNVPHAMGDIESRIALLEENERKQAELVSQMAEQMAVMTKLVVELRSRLFWMTGVAALAAVLAIVAIALR